MSRHNFSRVYAGLKDFQRNTVEYAFQRMYLDDPPARRFLVADEVGLGKTLVARGLIARGIEHLDREGVERIDVVYICSNSNIAKQNISRLNVTGDEDFAFASRITLLAAELKKLTKNRLNFVSFTPGTSFDLKSNLGQQDERMLLYWLLRRAWKLPGSKGPKRAFQGTVRRFSDWEDRLSNYQSRARRVDSGVRHGFFALLERHDQQAAAAGQPTLRERFDVMASEWARDRRNRPWEEHHRRNVFVGELRGLLARATIDALEPDIIILDEFQRFKHLLAGESEAAQLAHSMFNYGDEHTDARVLLLSATPYKMYTLSDESADDDHYSDFVNTVDFLLYGGGADFRNDLEVMRRALLKLDDDPAQLMASKDRVERRLRSVMARTERLAVTQDRSGMLVHADDGPPPLEAQDLVGYVAMDRAARELDAPGPLEMWKSAAYFANFWDDYAIGKRFRKNLDEAPETAVRVQQILTQSPGLLPWSDHRRFEQLDPGNARLRHLWEQTIERDMWKLLWLPPSLPYYELSGPFASEQARTFTKRLLFSAWAVVPKAVSTLTSYEAERRMMTSRRGARMENTPEAREKIAELLRFPKTLTGMTAFAVIYPSPSLARLADPLKIAAELRSEGTEPTRANVLDRAKQHIMRRLRRHLPKEGPEDDRWYWAAPLVLDRDLPHQNDWLRWRARFAWTDSAGAGLRAHLSVARQAHRGELDLGRPPDDLGEVLALLAVGGPGNVALRALGRFTRTRRSPYTNETLRNQAARIAWGFRSLYNTPEVINLVRGMVRSGAYWRKVLHYGVDGCLQAVLDEYLHVARDWHGILEVNDEADMQPAAEGLAEVVSLQNVNLHAQDPLDPEAEHRMRCRFALPFGQYRSEDDQHLQRSSSVRAAFNSPFWPFILSTTSIGQEGLDFHLYCHAVVHWNLPANPVDLEQREGRVHRYLGHAVRKNLAATYGDRVPSDTKDPWESIIDAAIAERDPTTNDLVPYWVFEGDAKIERHVPSLPLSREEGRLHDLKRSLALYRMVFGQPRQEELLEWLRSSADDALTDSLRVDLTPGAPKATNATHTSPTVQKP